jgi:GNAT superfamily N-acetyltransferase
MPPASTPPHEGLARLEDFFDERRSGRVKISEMVPTITDVDLLVADDEATRAHVSRLRYDVFVRERRCAPPDADHVGRRLRDHLDPTAIVLAARDCHTKAIVGTIRTNLLCDGPVPVYPTVYRLTDLSAGTWMNCSVTTYLAVAAPYRRAGLGTELSRALYEIWLERGVKFDYLDCAADVVPFFQRLGYRWLRAIRHPWFGPSHLMRLSVLDADHLNAVRSPFVVRRGLTV